jgi:hypothetical protein
MPAPARKEPAPTSATDRLDAARGDHTAASSKLNELETARATALLADEDDRAAALDAQIEQQKRLVRVFHDKINLLQEQAAAEEQARRAQEKAALIERIEAKIEKRDAAMQEVAAAIKQLAVASEKAIKLSRDITAAWTWPPHDLAPALLTPPAIMTAIAHECFRTSYHPRRYGGADTDPLAGIMLPGGRAPTLQLLEDPARVRAMVDVVADASNFAKRFLRTGKGSAAVEAGAQNYAPATNGDGAPQRSDAEQRKIALEKQMIALAEDPAREAEYNNVVAALVRVDAEIAAQKQGEQQHG